jgi:hypothetical protein
MRWTKLVLALLLAFLILFTGLSLSCMGLPGAAAGSTCAERYGLVFLTRPEAGYPVAWGLVILCGTMAVFAARSTIRAVQAHPNRTTWRTTARLFGWLYVAGCAGLVALMLLASTASKGRGMEALTTLRVVESLVPLGIGVHAALMCSLDDEPGLEVFLAAPRPFAWIALERLAMAFVLYGLIAVTASVAALQILGMNIDGLPIVMARWLAPALFFVGLGPLVTFSSRNAAFGVSIVIAVWSAMTMGFDSLMARWAFLWPFHVYLQPGGAADSYALNRLVIGLLGVFFLVNAIRELRDEEHILLGKADRQFPIRSRLAVRLPGKTEQAGAAS